MSVYMNNVDVCDMQLEPIESAIISVTVGMQRQLPVSLDLVLQRIGAAVNYIQCSDAFTHFQPSGPTIYLSPAASNVKARFILAHELAHVMLRSRAAAGLIEDRGLARLLDNEEDLANRIAGTLLVPDNWIERIRRTQFAPAQIWELARLAEIPLPMLIRRMKSAGTDIALLHWKHGKRSWQVIDRPGIPFFLHGHVEISALSRRTFDHLGREESDVIIDCHISDRWARIRGRGYRFGARGEHVLQFLAPKTDIMLVDTRQRN